MCFLHQKRVEQYHHLYIQKDRSNLHKYNKIICPYYVCVHWSHTTIDRYVLIYKYSEITYLHTSDVHVLTFVWQISTWRKNMMTIYVYNKLMHAAILNIYAYCALMYAHMHAYMYVWKYTEYINIILDILQYVFKV